MDLKDRPVSRFVGQSRLLLVDGLVEMYDGLLNDYQPRWVSLEGPSGWGKTRVVQEFYACLASRQVEPRYWPERIDDKELGRKATQPRQFAREPNSLPDFLWWGVGCSVRSGLAMEALRRDVERLSAHGLYLEYALRRLAPARERGKWRASSVNRMVVEEGAVELVTHAVETVAAAAPFVGIATRLARWASNETRRKIQERRDIASETVFGEDQPLGIVEDTVDILAKLAGAGFPIIIVVEDAHAADETLLELLDHVLRRGGSILLITTAWPEHGETINHPFGALMREYEHLLIRVGHTVEAGPPFPSGAGLQRLEGDALASILHSYYPAVEDDTRDWLLQRYMSPLALELFCQIEIYHKGEGFRTTDGALRVPEGKRRGFPYSIRELYQKLWAELPREMQFALAVSHVLMPASINPDVAKNEEAWMATLLEDVLSGLEGIDSAVVLDTLDGAPTAYAWMTMVDEYLRAFAEEAQKDVAKRDGYMLLEEKLDEPRERILDRLAEILIEADADVVSSVNGARSILALNAIGKIADHDIVGSAIEFLISDLTASFGELAERLFLFDLYCRLDPPPTSNATTFAIRQFGAWALAEAGRLEESIAVCEELLLDQVQLLGADDSSTLLTRQILAGRLGEAGRVMETVSRYEELLKDRTRVQGFEHPDTLITRHNLAGWIGSSGRIEEAIDVYDTVLAGRVRELGPDHPHTLATRHNLAYWHGKAGRVKEAVSRYEELLTDRTRVLGPDHPQTLVTRNNLGRWLGEAGRVDEAVIELEGVRADRLRVLGPDHPHTLLTRHNLANWLGEAGRVEEAVVELEQVVKDRLRVLGPENPDTFSSIELLKEMENSR